MFEQRWLVYLDTE